MQAARGSAAEAFKESQELLYVRINDVVIRLQLVEAKDSKASKSEHASSKATSLPISALQMGHSMGSCVLGQQRTSFVFAKLRAPLQLNGPAAEPAF